MEKLVEVSEQEVQIDFKLGSKCRAKIHLKSLSKCNPIAFKVQTSAPHKFLVSPPNGLIPPSSSTSFQVILKPQSRLPTSFPRSPSERFLIKTALAPDLEEGHAYSVSSWFSSTSRVTVDIKLKVFYVGTFLLLQALANDDIESIKQITKRKRPELTTLSLHENLAFLEAASSSSNPNILRHLIESGLKVDDTKVNPSSVKAVPAQSESVPKCDSSMMVSKGWSQLHLAAATGEHETLERLVFGETKGGTVDCRDKQGRTPLHLAASKGHTMCARLLVEAGADKDTKGSDGRTALFRAAANGEAEMVALLVEKGADPNITAGDIHGLSPLDVARQKGHVSCY